MFWIAGRYVTHFGRRGEKHVEHFALSDEWPRAQSLAQALCKTFVECQFESPKPIS